MLRDWATIKRVTDHYRAVTAGVEAEVKERMRSFPPCHDWWHIHYVRKVGRHIALIEAADPYIVDLALICHELGDKKFDKSNAPPRDIVREVLSSHETHSSVVVEEVCDIVHNMQFRNRGAFGPMPTLNGSVAQDADMLSAMGVIGIARAFTTGCFFGQSIHVPGSKPRTPEEMLVSSIKPASTLMHFQEKLLKLKWRMNTKEGRRLAKKRHTALAKFVHRFEKEWNVEL